jgi:hypothetical protein
VDIADFVSPATFAIREKEAVVMRTKIVASGENRKHMVSITHGMLSVPSLSG